MLVLASASPRRQELLRNAGILFTVEPTDIPEIPRSDEFAKDVAERLAREKALAISSNHPDQFVLGADTVVLANGHILGKPQDHADAARMLRLLSGRSHQVLTGVCLVGPKSSTTSRSPTSDFAVADTRSETTLVTMTELSEDDISYYIATGEPMDKAGAYAIQGIASRWILRIEGDYPNVVGLPVALVYRMLCEHGCFQEKG
jgi:septum formation protein